MHGETYTDHAGSGLPACLAEPVRDYPARCMQLGAVWGVWNKGMVGAYSVNPKGETHCVLAGGCSFTYGDDTASTGGKRAAGCPSELPNMLVNLVRNL